MISSSDVIIIGAGISGMTAALYLKRAGINFMLFEGSKVGGQINLAYKVENYPGTGTISGLQLSQKILSQLQDLNVEFIQNKIISITTNNDNYIIKCNDNTEFETKKVIIATGRSYKKLNVKGANKYIGKGISYCATCDGRFFKGKNVILVGANNKAIEEAIFLAKLCSKITIICKHNKMLANEHYLNKLKEHNNIEIIYNAEIINFDVIDDVIVGGKVKTINDDINLSFSACFVYNGYEANSSFVNDFVNIDDDGYIIVDHKCETNKKNIYACGDVIKKDIYQLVTATNDGAIAAMFCISEEVKDSAI